MFLGFKSVIVCDIILVYLVITSAASDRRRAIQREFFTLHKWTQGLEMTFPSESERDAAIKAGYYDLARIQLPVDIDIEYKGTNTYILV